MDKNSAKKEEQVPENDKKPKEQEVKEHTKTVPESILKEIEYRA